MPLFSQQSDRPKKDVYFVQDQVMLLVEHPVNFSPDEVASRIQRMTPVKENLNGATLDTSRIISFRHRLPSQPAGAVASDAYQQPEVLCESGEPKRYLPVNTSGQAFDDRLPPHRRASQEWFSMVYFDLPQQPGGQAKVTSAIERLNNQIYAQISQSGPVVEFDLALRAAAPNWLSTPSPDNAGGGGPGGRPIEAQPDIYEFAIPNLPMISELRQQAGDGVEVAILDTAPRPEILEYAYNRWVTGPRRQGQGQQAQPHPLLQELLEFNGAFDIKNPGATLNVTYAGEIGSTLPDPSDLRVKHHNFAMPDHGLFAAGIIHSLAPKAKLRLIEVLNAYGVGTLENIGRGLKLLANERLEGKTTPLVINVSLTIVTPLVGHPKTDLANDWPLFKADEISPQRQMQGLSLEWICASLRGQNVIIVASAGNDANDPDSSNHGQVHDPKDRPQARNPAAFPTVLGVGALLEDSDDPTDYSNWSDEPEGMGITTFGGAQKDRKAEQRYSILGAYTGFFPGDKQPGDSDDDPFPPKGNNYGWAWWSGTSFAAPIISGAVAALTSLRGSLVAAENELNNAVTPPNATSIGGNIRAKQGS